LKRVQLLFTFNDSFPGHCGRNSHPPQDSTHLFSLFPGHMAKSWFDKRHLAWCPSQFQVRLLFSRIRMCSSAAPVISAEAHLTAIPGDFGFTPGRGISFPHFPRESPMLRYPNHRRGTLIQGCFFVDVLASYGILEDPIQGSHKNPNPPPTVFFFLPGSPHRR